MIFPVESQSSVRSAPALPLTTRLGPVQIAVTDRDKALVIWRDVVGLELISETGNELRLGAGGKVLIVLETGAVRPVVQRTTGLYHVAILYPTRALLADALRRVLAAGIELDGASDHGVSEALYLRDPDENGVELYRDRPKEEWPRAPDGSLAMFTKRLDLDDLLRQREV